MRCGGVARNRGKNAGKKSACTRLTASSVATHVSARKQAASPRERNLPAAPRLDSKNLAWTTASSYPAGASPVGKSTAYARRHVRRVVAMLPRSEEHTSAL